MKILSIEKEISHIDLDIISIKASELDEHKDIESYSYIIINGGDGSIRRVLRRLKDLKSPPIFILNPIGSLNVVAKLHQVSACSKILDKLANNQPLKIEKHHLFHINDDIFLFSAGNMGDLQHILISETLRFGWLKNGMGKYLLAILILLPAHIILTPFMLLSTKRFFIFTPFRFIKKFGSFYGEVNEIDIYLDNDYNMLELDGDIVTVYGKHIRVREAGSVPIAVG
jgi:hypothetical protein